MELTTSQIVLYVLIGSGALLILYHWKAVLYLIWSAFKGLAIGVFLFAAIYVAGAFLGGKV